MSRGKNLLADSEQVKERQSLEGAALIAAIRDKVKRDGLDMNMTIRSFGFTPIYFTSLANGHRPTSALQRKSLEAIAQFLNIPYAEAAVLSGKLRVEDFFLQSTLADELNVIYAKMQEDPAWMIFAPSNGDWTAMSDRAKLCIALLYEKVKSIDILTKANLPKEIVVE